MEEESKSFVSVKVQEEISQAIRQSVEYLKVKCNCEIVSDFKFAELKNSCEIAGSALYTLEDIPNLLKAENHNLALELLKSAIGQSNYTFNLLFFYTLQYIFGTFVTNDGYLKKNEYLKQLFTVCYCYHSIIFI